MCTKLLLWYEVLCVCVCWEGAWQFIMFITVIALILTHYTHTHRIILTLHLRMSNYMSTDLQMKVSMHWSKYVCSFSCSSI